MNYQTLTFDVRDHVAFVTLNRPKAMNTINADVARELWHVAIRCDEDANVRAVLLAGAGANFSGGGDLKTFLTAGADLPARVKEITTYLHGAISRLVRMDAPVIAAVQGNAAGAGMSLAMASDLVIAADTARFMMAYTAVGLTPDGSASYFLPRIVGLKRALELTLTNRPVPAQEALALGMVTRVVPEGEVLAQAEALAKQLAAGPTRALGGAKRLLHGAWTETLETQMEWETRAIADMTRTADAKEGITAFVEKRAAKFCGA